MYNSRCFASRIDKCAATTYDTCPRNCPFYMTAEERQAKLDKVTERHRKMGVPNCTKSAKGLR